MLDDLTLNQKIKSNCQFHISNNHLYVNKKSIDNLINDNEIIIYLNDVKEKTGSICY